MNKPHIMAAPNGARRQKTLHPALPITIAETVAAAKACNSAGADALHLHVRDSKGRHSLDAGLYREALAEMENHVPEMPVQITTESAGIYDTDAQFACLTALTPRAASISVREVARMPELAPRIYGLCAEAGTEVQHILFDSADLAQLNLWRRQGVIRADQRDVILVLGAYDPPREAELRELAPRVGELPGDLTWSVCAFGRHEHACLIEAARLGGSLRVGFENNVLRPDGKAYSDNADSVARLVAEIKGASE
ncbi:MAG: 3-keto-5-aminohexanoate cleavage protein [Pseudomonadota bacterium]